MRHKMIVDNGYIAALMTEGFTGVEISEAIYSAVIDTLSAKPTTPSGYEAKLRADTLEWVLVELPPMPEYDDEATAEDYEAALSEVGV